MSTSRRNAVGESDPIERTCSCELNAGGTVISFYKYVKLRNRAAEVADAIVAFGAKQPPGALTGKIRVAHEGINASLAASEPSTMKAFTDFIESLDALALKGEGAVDYKPEPGCAHLFPNLSVRFVDELCPFGERELGVEESENIDSLTPERWHEALESRKEDESYVLDVRNFYESRVGSFAGADLAPIRRFSQLKEWFAAREDVLKHKMANKDLYIYCTGGVRCEKVATYVATKLPEELRPRAIHKLEGGIVSYAKKIDKSESLFKGSNYVFDARGTVQIGPEDELPQTAWCDGCGQASGRLGKCSGRLCHYVLIACDACETECGVFCCGACREQTERSQGEEKFKRRPCDCDCFESRERRCKPFSSE